MSARRSPQGPKLVIGLIVLACCSGGTPPVGGLLASPAGMALANTLLFVSNQEGNELHVFDTQARQFRPSPNLMFPLSVATVRRPGAVCGNGVQIFTTSTADATLGVIDAFDDRSESGDPTFGLRELGQIALPGVATDAVCTESPAAVLAHENAEAGSPGQYLAEIDAGGIVIDDDQADGGERGFLATLPVVALLAINDPGATSGTQIWQAGNDPTCGLADGGHGFCPSLQPLMTLSSQTPGACDPIVGPPLALRVDASGANAGDVNVDPKGTGRVNVDPSTLNRLVASDRNSNCIASVDLNDQAVRWLPANGPTSAVYTMPYLPGTCLPGGDLVAAVLDGENCERQGLPPTGGYQNCNGVSFLSIGQGGLLPEPLPYPFTPRRPMPPVRISDLVQKVTFVGRNVQISFPGGPINPIPTQLLAIVGTGSGNLVYVDIGIGRTNGGAGADDDGGFACPAAYLAPRLFDITDYISNPVPPQISGVAVSSFDGGASLGGVLQVAADALTSGGAATPTSDRQNLPFSTPVGTSGQPLDIETCYGIPSGAELCVTGGLVQKGVAQNETFVATYEGPIAAFGEVSGTLSGDSLQIAGFGDLTAVDDGLLVTEGADGGNLTVQLSQGSVSCGNYAISAVTAGALTLTPTPTCSGGSVTASIVASGQKPYTLQGTSTGVLNQLWPMDGTLHLVTSQRWHYPADLIGMLRGAEQLADFVEGPIQAPAAAGSTVSAPRADGADSAALDSSFGLALRGPLGVGGVDGGLDGGAFLPASGATWSFSVTSGVQPLIVTPTGIDTVTADALIDGMASYSDSDGGHVYATYRGGNALVELVPSVASSGNLFVFH